MTMKVSGLTIVHESIAVLDMAPGHFLGNIREFSAELHLLVQLLAVAQTE
jgi:hypothetical protein